jgi:hypothetical protein
VRGDPGCRRLAVRWQQQRSGVARSVDLLGFPLVFRLLSGVAMQLPVVCAADHIIAVRNGTGQNSTISRRTRYDLNGQIHLRRKRDLSKKKESCIVAYY